MQLFKKGQQPLFTVAGSSKSVKSILVLLIITALLLSCGTKKAPSPYLGVWSAKEYKVLGATKTVQELGSSTLDFKDNGKVEAVFLQESLTADWESTKDGLLIKDGSTKIPVQLLGDDLQLSYGGVDMVFAKGEVAVVQPPVNLEPTQKPAETTGVAEEDGNLTPTQKQWNGYWFGSFWIPEVYGADWAGSEGYLEDYYVYIEVDEEGFGFMDGNTEPFDATQEYLSEYSMWIQADEYHFEQVKDEAWFWDMDIIEGENGKDFWFGPTPDNKDAVVMAGRYIDPEVEGEQGFDFIITIFRWGSEWDYNVSNNPPPGYEDYLEAVELGMNPENLASGTDVVPPADVVSPPPASGSDSGPKFTNKYEALSAIVYYPDGGEVKTTSFGDTEIVFESLGFQVMPRQGMDTYENILKNYEDRAKNDPDMVIESIKVDNFDATMYKYEDDILGPSIDVYIRHEDGEAFVMVFTTLDYSGKIDKLESIPEINQIIQQVDILD